MTKVKPSVSETTREFSFLVEQLKWLFATIITKYNETKKNKQVYVRDSFKYLITI